MITSYLRWLRWPLRVPTIRKVEPIESISKELPDDNLTEVIVVEDSPEKKKLPKEYRKASEKKHRLSIWV
jgi:hypothetical protein